MSSNILVSLGQICQVEGVSFSGDRSIFTITRGRDIILTASAYARNLWALDVDVLVPNMAASVTVSPKEIEIDFARGMCTPCVECRQHKTPFPTSQTIIDRPLQANTQTTTGPGRSRRKVRLQAYSLGIKQETTIADTPEQNGKAERANRTIEEKLTALLLESGLPAEFWAKALNYATYILARTIRKTTGKSRYEHLHGVPPSYERLRVFGCTAVDRQKQHEPGDFLEQRRV